YRLPAGLGLLRAGGALLRQLRHPGDRRRDGGGVVVAVPVGVADAGGGMGRGRVRVVGPQPVQQRFGADVRGPARVAVPVEPVGKPQPRRVVVRRGAHRGVERLVLAARGVHHFSFSFFSLRLMLTMRTGGSSAWPFAFAALIFLTTSMPFTTLPNAAKPCPSGLRLPSKSSSG